MPHLGGCQCYFTPDGVWGFLDARAGRADLQDVSADAGYFSAGRSVVMPPEATFLYFPMVSNDQRLFALRGCATARVTDYVHTDYDIFLAPIDPATLEVTGPAVRYTFDPKCDRFPDVLSEPRWRWDIGADKVPYDVVAYFRRDRPATGMAFGDSETISKAAVGNTYSQSAGNLCRRSTAGRTEFRGQVRMAAAGRRAGGAGAVLENNREIVVSFSEPVAIGTR